MQFIPLLFNSSCIEKRFDFFFYPTLPLSQVFNIDFLKNLSLSLQSTVPMPKFLLGVYWSHLTATHSVLLRTLQWAIFSTCFQNPSSGGDGNGLSRHS